MALILAQDFISLAFRYCGQMRPGYTLQPEQMAEALSVWGSLFDSWAAERTMGFSIPTQTHAVTGPGSESGGNGYTIGPSGADWTGPRPESIVRANLVMTNVGPQPVYLPIRMISVEEWAALAIRQIPAINVTNIAYYDPQFPNGVFNVFPPLNGNSVEIFQWQALAVPAMLTTPYSAPPGYMDAVVFSLAERLWPLCTRQMMANMSSQQWLAGRAYECCQKVRAVNRPIPTLYSEAPGNKGQNDGFADTYVKYVGEPY